MEKVPETIQNWEDDNSSAFCRVCNDAFTFYKRRHHCRWCGLLICYQCCGPRYLPLLGTSFASHPQRLCIKCYKHFTTDSHRAVSAILLNNNASSSSVAHVSSSEIASNRNSFVEYRDYRETLDQNVYTKRKASLNQA